MTKFKLKSGNKSSFKRMGATEAIKQVDTSSTGYSSQDKSKMHTEREIYKAKLRGDYQDLTGDKLKKASYDDPTGQVMSRDPHYLDSPAKQVKGNMPKDFNIKGGPSKTPGYSSTKMAKNPASTLDRTTKAMQNIPKQFTKATSKNLGKLATGVIKKGVGRLAAGPVAGLAGAAYGAYKSGKKHSGGKAGSKEGQAKWKAQKEKAPKSDIWGKNK